MVVALESSLTRIEEITLYHHPDDRGFFTVLSVNPRKAQQAAVVAATRQKLQQALKNYLSAASTDLITPDLQLEMDSLRAKLAELPQIQSKVAQAYRLHDLLKVVEQLDPGGDTWISQAEFAAPYRRLVHLLRIYVCFADLDTYKTFFSTDEPDTLCHKVYGYCLDEDIPAPSLIIYSGRGLQVKWLLERPIPRAALPRWNAVQKVLVERLSLYGADMGARDAARVLRVVDTINSRSGESVRVLLVNRTDEGEVRRYNFEYLAEVVLPMARETIREDRRAKTERQSRFKVLKGQKTGNLRAFSGPQLAWDRLDDLRTLAKLRGWIDRGIPHGYRSKYVHWCLNFLALSGAIHSGELYREAKALVQEVCPDFSHDKNVSSVLSTLYKKAKAYNAGERVEFEGKMYPPLYTPRNSTLLTLFDVTDAEIPHLKTIIPKKVAQTRHAEREQLRRESRGGAPQSNHLKMRKEMAKQREMQARFLRSQGLTWAEVGKRMGGISAKAARMVASR